MKDLVGLRVCFMFTIGVLVRGRLRVKVRIRLRDRVSVRMKVSTGKLES